MSEPKPGIPGDVLLWIVVGLALWSIALVVAVWQGLLR